MIHLLFRIGDILTSGPRRAEQPLQITLATAEDGTLDREQDGFPRVSLGHLVLIHGIPNRFLVSQIFAHDGTMLFIRLTFFNLLGAMLHELALSAWFLFLQASFQVGFLDCRAGDRFNAERWRWAFWRPRRFPEDAPLPLHQRAREQVLRFCYAIRGWF